MGAGAALLVVTAWTLAASGGVYAAPPPIREAAGNEPRSGPSPFRVDSAGQGLVLVDWDRDRLRAAWAGKRRFLAPTFPLQADTAVDLLLEPFSVTGPRTRFVLGRVGQPDRPLDFDPRGIALFRGEVRGRPGSHVFLALGEERATGYLDLGAGEPLYRISSRGHDGEKLGPGKISIFRSSGAAPSLPPDVPLCGTGHDAPAAAVPAGAAPRVGPAPVVRLKHLEIAIETDHEFFQLFGSSTDAAAYVVELYAQISDIYQRDVDTWVEVVFVRIWDDPDDLFNDVDPSPLPEFRGYWNAVMRSVQRDAAQLISGRRDYPFGGQAYLSALCGSSAYSVVGYMLGFFPDPSRPSPYTYDVSVPAHELGHNSGTGHTHDSPNNIDTCADPTSTPQRGTIMSYCGQTWSGGNANRDNYFHARIQQNMDAHINGVGCIAADCNKNAVADGVDIQQSTSQDANANGVPDECEDCNANTVLDGQDIALGTSFDLNSNGVPDECEPDCNANNVPDGKDIADRTSLDLHGNDIPDECEPDCDMDGTSDYTEIQADMTLDLDRDAVLDACQDCDASGPPDLEVLDGAHHAWIASGLRGSPIREFHATTGVRTRVSSGAFLDEAQDLIVTGDGRVLVTSGLDDRVVEFDRQGNYVGDLAPSQSGGLSHPTGLLMLPDGTLLVASRDTDSVLAYDGDTGTPLGAFVGSGSGGLDAPFGLTRGPTGNLLVTSATNEVLEYDGTSGAFVGAFVGAGANGGLDRPRGLTFKPDGNLLVASFGTDEVLEFDGRSGAPLGKWAQVGTATRLTQVSPWGVRVGPNGNVFVVRTGEDYGSGAGLETEHDHEHDDAQGRIQALHLTNAQIYEFDARNGNFLRSHVNGNDHDLLFPTGFDFVPGWGIDCNLNLLPDACDIASGHSQDADSSGVPDECEVDCNANQILDRLDIIPHGASLDCNANLTPDECDLDGGASQDCNLNRRPDECEGGCPTCQLDADCDDGLACTTQSCDQGAGVCGYAVAPASCVIDGACHADGQTNPLNDCEVCDAPTPLVWTPSPPLAVAGLLVARVGSTRLQWLAQPEAVYDVAGGDVSTLRADGGVAGATCLADDLGVTIWDDVRPDPLAGDGYYYLLRAEKDCGPGPWGGPGRTLQSDCP